jgi:hypothetical protein
LGCFNVWNILICLCCFVVIVQVETASKLYWIFVGKLPLMIHTSWQRFSLRV